MRAWILLIAACGGSGGSHGPALTQAEVEKACVEAYGCMFEGFGGKTVNTCFDRLGDGDTLVSQHRPDQISCLAAAGDCATARACIGITMTSGCSPTGTSCSGTKLLDCSGGNLTQTECASGLWYSADSTCIDSGTGKACGTTTCNATSSPYACDGTKALTCTSGVSEPFDCAIYGMTCRSDVGAFLCGGATSAPMCSTPRCDGNTLVRCEDFREVRVDCAAMFAGGTCANNRCGFGSACDPVSLSTCNGNVLSNCVLGVATTFDCAANGFRSCMQGECVPATFP